MALELLVDKFSEAEWSALAREFTDHNLYQTWSYGELRARVDHVTVSRAVATLGGRVVALAQVRLKRIPMLRAGIAYVHHGPLWQRDGCRPQDLREMIDLLQVEFGEKRGLSLRIAPGLTAECDAASEILESAGFLSNCKSPDQTILLDLTPQLAELRKGLAQKWRNCLNFSQRQGLTVTGHTSDEQMDTFQSLYDQMWTRKQFTTGVSVASFRDLQALLPAGERLHVFIASHNGIPVAGHVSSTLGATCVYLLGASNDLGRQSKAAYLLQWNTVEHAQRLGARWYDLGGIDPVTNPGVYHFKSGLGGREVAYPRCRSMPRRGPARVLLPLAEGFYRGLRRLHKQKEALQA